MSVGSSPSPSTNAEGRIEIIPVSRQNHLLRSLRRYSSQGASLYVYRIETASKETDKLKEWKRRYQSVSTARCDKVSSEPRNGHEMDTKCKE